MTMRLIRWSSDPLAFVSGCLMEQLGRGTLVGPDEEPSLFKQMERSPLPEELPVLLRMAQSRLFLHSSWNEPEKYAIFWKALRLALRWRGKDQSQLCHDLKTAIFQSFQQGISAVIARTTPESVRLFKSGREVSHDLHRAYGFTRLVPVKSNRDKEFDKLLLVGRCESPHRIGDFVASYFARRNPNCRIAIVIGGTAWCGEERKRPWLEKADTYQSFLDDPSFENVWMTFYDSQFIPERKNKRLAQQRIPKKYWDWIPEGKRIAALDGE